MIDSRIFLSKIYENDNKWGPTDLVPALLIPPQLIPALLIPALLIPPQLIPALLVPALLIPPQLIPDSFNTAY